MRAVLLTEIKNRFDIGNRRFSWTNEKRVSAHTAYGVQNRVEPQFFVLFVRFANPPIRKKGELLRAIGFAAIQGQASRRLAITLTSAKQAEIAGTQERAQFIKLLRPIQRVENFESGITRIGGDLVLDGQRPVIEEILHKPDGLHMS